MLKDLRPFIGSVEGEKEVKKVVIRETNYFKSVGKAEGSQLYGRKLRVLVSEAKEKGYEGISWDKEKRVATLFKKVLV